MSILFLIIPCRPRAEENEASTPTSNQVPKLLVFLAATDERGAQLEEQLVAELRLTLDDVVVEQVFIQAENFLSLPLPDQLEVARPLIGRFDAVAAVWIADGGQLGHLIQFVVSAETSSIVRTVEAGSPDELALAIRELLGDAYLINPERLRTDADALDDPSRLNVLTLGEIGGGIHDPEGASLNGGLGIGASYFFTPSLYGIVSFMGKIGPRHEVGNTGTGGGLMLGWRLEPGVEAGYLWWFDRLGLGPCIWISAIYSSMNIVVGGGEYTTKDWLAVRGALGMDLLFRVSRKISLRLAGNIGVLSRPKEFERQSDSSTLLRTPLVDYNIILGLVMGVQ